MFKLMLAKLLISRSNRIIVVCLLLTGCYATTNLNNSELNYIPDQDSLSQGEHLYTGYCLQCHGADFTGNGPMANELKVKPANLKEKSFHFTQTSIKGVVDYPHYSHETIRDKIKYGNHVMPALKEVLTKDEINTLVNYISYAIRQESAD